MVSYIISPGMCHCWTPSNSKLIKAMAMNILARNQNLRGRYM